MMEIKKGMEKDLFTHVSDTWMEQITTKLSGEISTDDLDEI